MHPIQSSATRSNLFQHETAFSGSPLPVAEEEPGSSNEARKRILIADDDPVVRSSLAAVIELRVTSWTRPAMASKPSPIPLNTNLI